MTVRAVPPFIEYTGDGVTTKYDWDWDMIDDSSINVMVDNENVTYWSLEDQSVVFTTAPVDGALIIIYRRTIIWMPEDYVAFGRFLADKTELSLDRVTLIAQERMGDAINNEPPNGIVGGSDLSITRGEFDVTVVSERGTDAVVPMYDPDGVDPVTPADPDPTIIWGGIGTFNVVNGGDSVVNGLDDVVDSSPLSTGNQIFAGIYSLPSNTNGVAATIRFRMDLLEGDPTEASSYYPNYNALAYTSWCAVDPADNEYWMRVTAAGDIPPSSRYQIFDPVNGNKALGDEFPISAAPAVPFDVITDRADVPISNRAGVLIFPRDAIPFEEGIFGPFVSVFTFGDTAPSVRIGTFNIEICKDNGTGQPDDAWVSRIVTLEAIFNA